MELSKKQREIAETNCSKCIVCASAAAGKSRVLTERIKFLLSRGVQPNRIVAITYTNAAADNIRRRLPEAEDVHISTIHSYANYLLLCAGIDTAKFLKKDNNKAKFDRLFKEVQQNLLCIQPVDYLLLDEAQDSNEKQLNFLLDLVKPKNFMIFCDVKQSIYRWNGAEPDLLLDLMQRPGITVFSLTDNYRNAIKILEFAKQLINSKGYIGYYDTSIAMRDRLGIVNKLVYSPKTVQDIISNSNDEYGDWFVICRLKDDCINIYERLLTNKIPCVLIDTQDDKRAIETAAGFAENKVKIMTIHQAKGLESKNVIAVLGSIPGLEEDCIRYVAATRAMDRLYWLTKPTKKQLKDKMRVERWG